MKKEVIITAKTVEEAVALAVTELGAPSADKIEYTVLEEPKKGFLGLGATDAKISATYTAGGQARAIAFVRQLLSDMNIEAEIAVTEGGKGEVRIAISGERAAVLIGHHGETLDSLQYLANLAANKRIDGKKEEYTKVSVDVEGYRAKREETLRALARRMATKVLKYKKSVMLEPMNPYERRIIHSEIQQMEGVSTNSIGSENNRKIVIFLDGEEN
ncbi:MAG: protein jag [Ruminococcaceae bacterium]|nr:protein jag [Oscillospiraceae bacterium]